MQRLLTQKTFLPVLCLVVWSMNQTEILAAASPCNPARWQDDITKFDAGDNSEPPAKGGVLFVGSSSIRLWNLEKYFPDKAVINRGFGGSELCDSVHFFDTLVNKHRPKQVVLYAGDNDVANGKKAAQVLADFRAFETKIKEKLPACRLIYISIKPSLARWKLAAEMKQANKLIATECQKQPSRLVFLDIWQPMLGDDGKPRKELFADDGLHLNGKGYELWTSLLIKELDREKSKQQ